MSRKRLAIMLIGVFGAGYFAAASIPTSTEQVSEQEAQLVKELHRARENYQACMERLRSYYMQINKEESRKLIDREMTDFHMLVKDPYILELDLPGLDLKATSSIAKANKVFRDALDWMNKSSVSDREANYKRAELLFRRLIRDYPQTDKLDEACYYLGVIYSSRYFQQYNRATGFFERVIHYDANTNLDARMQAATLYEKYLANRRRAIELYQEILRREVDPAQTDKARKRLDELLGTR